MFPTYSEWLTAAEAAAAATTSKQGEATAPTRAEADEQQQPTGVAADALPVLVIGAGPAGLAVMAELTARCIPYVCMEQALDVGGMWDRRHNPASPVYPSLCSNVSRFSMTLDQPFDMPQHWPTYVPHELALSYLQTFADRHRLRPHIRFHHRVQRCEYDEETRRWHVHFTRTADNSEATADFSDLIVATGQNNRNSASLPAELLAQAQRSGLTVRHTSECVDEEEFRDQRVLVVGLGISGAGLASLISRVARRTFVAVRTPQYLIPSWLFGYPTDQATAGDLPDLTSLPHWLSAALLWLGRRLLGGVEYLLARKTVALGMRRPRHSVLDKGPVVTDDGFEAAVRAQRIVLRSEVVGFEPGRALYSRDPGAAVTRTVDGDDIDAVIFATGYSWTFLFLPPALHPTTCVPSVIDTGRRPSACYNAPTTRASSLTLNLFSPHSAHLYFMIEVVHVYSAWPIFGPQARAIVSCLEARRRGSKRAAAFDRVSAGGFPNPSFSGPFYKAEFWKAGDEFYVDRGLYVTFLGQFRTWIEGKSA